LQRLVDAGIKLLVIEQTISNVIKRRNGALIWARMPAKQVGRLVCQGTSEQVARAGEPYGKFYREIAGFRMGEGAIRIG